MTLLRLIIVIILSASLWLAGIRAEKIPAYPSDDFVERIGVNTHLNYTDTPYAQSWERIDRKDIQTLIGELGVRYIRDGLASPQTNSNIYALPRFANLYEANGIKISTGFNYLQSGKLVVGAQLEEKIENDLKFFATAKLQGKSHLIPVLSLISTFEGANEYDASAQGSDLEWVENLKKSQATIYRKVKAKATLNHIPILMPSMVNAKSCDRLGSIENLIDLSNLHPYPSFPYWRSPAAEFDWHLKKVRGCSGGKAVVVTETGYSPYHSLTPSRISETTIAKYIPRLLAEYYLRDIKRTYLYEFSDIPHHSVGVSEMEWGLVKAIPTQKQSNGFYEYQLEPKQQYTALQQLIALLSESRWDEDKLSYIRPAPYQTTSLNITFVKKKPTTNHLLLQKSNGEYFLLLWQEVENYNPQQGNFTVEPDQVVLNFDNRFSVIQHLYDENFRFISEKRSYSNKNLNINVPDSITVLQLTPESISSS
jgi:hypothetical protein